ncbi:DUF7606 domain-containing protein [Moraxella sp. Pampa]|uniref:ACP-like domain-containing protein n=1 Tax=Moraxella sp. Pampa TaxID=3111978 RepID=UPI002B416C15|nr:adhesin [Moraxella sp. Pampa]
MKILKKIAPVFIMGVALSGVASASDLMDARTADETATKIREVTYQCKIGGKVKVNFGFNEQKLPTFAESYLGGKVRFLPINLTHSNIASTLFGDENSWMIGSSAITLGNYHKSDILVQDPDSVIAYKHCKVIKVNKLKG